MEQRHKNILIGGLLAIVLVMAIGYAAFAAQLNINGTANITSKWDVHIKSITPGSPTGTASNKSATVGEDDLSATFAAELISPGDSITYTIVVENTGTLDAKLSNLTFDGGDNPAIVHTYSGISQNDVLNAGGEATFTITVKYDEGITSQPENTESAVHMQLTYVQA